MAKSRLKRDPSLKGLGMAKWGLGLGYFFLGLNLLAVIGLVAFFALLGSSFNAAVKEAQRAAQSERAAQASAQNQTRRLPTARQGQPETTGSSEASAEGSAADPLWTLDLSNAKTPDRPAAGRIHGAEFTVESAKFENGILTLRQGGDFFADRQFMVFLFMKEGEKPAGKTFVSKESGMNPHVHMHWKQDNNSHSVPKVEMFMDKYAIRLDFGQEANGKIPARIYLCVPDQHKSYVAGNFEVAFKDAGAGNPAARKR
jgi:type II secretory pathway pseudopilin PulG